MKLPNTEPPLNPNLKANAYWILGFVILIWGVELVNLSMGHRLCAWGIYPRTISGLIGIPLSPFLHNSIGHVLLNTFPFIVLGGLVTLRGTRVFLELSLFIILLGGIMLWLFGRPYYHVGASGLIFGYFGFLVALGWYVRNLYSLITALLAISLYGGILWGLLPIFSYISWEGHLFGLIAGIFGARLEEPENAPY